MKPRTGWIDPDDLIENCPECPINGYIRVMEVSKSDNLAIAIKALEFYATGHWNGDVCDIGLFHYASTVDWKQGEVAQEALQQIFGAKE